ncbi:hypothetical protein NLU13_6276 [Sarocladium strictum]|uniref:2EXR domain-containing protein n=1 Tax=Sarocladium strictum TaxID=5046 RepID=A0AA39GH60_SARSR|nr:hypothetical protein NLU13_6276 [Sarocladium strictum]
MARRRRAQRIVSSDDESDGSPKAEPSASSSQSDEESDEGNPFIDRDALDEDDDDASTGSEDSDGPGPTFHLFNQLPPELRDKIWDFFCPELTVSTRVLRMGLELDDDEATGHFWEGTHLEAMTETFRCLSSVHRESRQRALKFAPDEIMLGGHSTDAVIRVNGAKDILCLEFIHYSPQIEHPSQWQPKCGGPVQRIAIMSRDIEGMRNFGGIKPFQSLFPELKAVYNMSEEISLNDRWLRWCVSDYAQKYYHERLEDVDPVPQILPMLLAFPDTDRHPDFAKYSLGGLARNRCSQTTVEEIEESGLTLLPMVSFPYLAGLERFEKLEESKNVPLPQLPPDWPSDAEEEALAADDDEDGYESDGINDEELSEDDLSSEDELVPRPISPGSDADSHISVDSSSDNGAPAANLSSVEPSEDEDEAQTAVNTNTKRKRRVLSDSDDEADEDDKSAEPVAQTPRKRRRVARTLQSDSETETGDVEAAPRTTAHDGPDDEEVSPSSESSSEEEEAPPKRLSLAQRLRQEQQQHTRRRTEAHESGSEDEEDGSGESSEDDDEDEDERPRRGGAFFLNEASEEDEDEDEDEDGDGDEDEDEYDSEME